MPKSQPPLRDFSVGLEKPFGLVFDPVNGNNGLRIFDVLDNGSATAWNASALPRQVIQPGDEVLLIRSDNAELDGLHAREYRSILDHLDLLKGSITLTLSRPKYGVPPARKATPLSPSQSSDEGMSPKRSSMSARIFGALRRTPRTASSPEWLESDLPTGSPTQSHRPLGRSGSDFKAKELPNLDHLKDPLEKLKEISDQFKGGVNLMKPGRTFVKDGMLKKLASTGLVRKYYFLLLSDALLYSDKTKDGYILHKELPLAGSSVTVASSHTIVFSSTKVIQLAFGSQRSQHKWLSAIQGALAMLEGHEEQRSVAIKSTLVQLRTTGQRKNTYVKLFNDGTLSWGDTADYIKHSQKLSCIERWSATHPLLTTYPVLKTRIDEREKGRCFIITTTSMKLALIAPSTDHFDLWMHWAEENEDKASIMEGMDPMSPQFGQLKAFSPGRRSLHEARKSFFIKQFDSYASPEHEPYELLPIVLKGQMYGSNPTAIQHLNCCTVEHLCAYLPMLACLLFEIPFWMHEQAAGLVEALRQRSIVECKEVLRRMPLSQRPSLSESCVSLADDSDNSLESGRRSPEHSIEATSGRGQSPSSGSSVSGSVSSGINSPRPVNLMAAAAASEAKKRMNKPKQRGSLTGRGSDIIIFPRAREPSKGRLKASPRLETYEDREEQPRWPEMEFATSDTTEAKSTKYDTTTKPDSKCPTIKTTDTRNVRASSRTDNRTKSPHSGMINMSAIVDAKARLNQSPGPSVRSIADSQSRTAGAHTPATDSQAGDAMTRLAGSHSPDEPTTDLVSSGSPVLSPVMPLTISSSWASGPGSKHRRSATQTRDSKRSSLTSQCVPSSPIQQILFCIKSSGLLDGSPLSYGEGYRDWIDQFTVRDDIHKLLDRAQQSKVGDIVLPKRGEQIFHPFEVSYTITRLVVEKIFNSNAKPKLLSIYCCGSGQDATESVKTQHRLTRGGYQPHHSAPRGAFQATSLILKTGDDLRQDVSCVHIFNMMNTLWRQAGMDVSGEQVQSVCFGCLAISKDIGVVEYVPGTRPLKNIKELFSPIPDEWLQDNPGKGEEAYTGPRLADSAMQRLLATGVGSFVSAYCLGIKDRHHDNILVKEDGTLFHIDFGHILGDTVALDTGEFAITQHLLQTMGDEAWLQFVDACVEAFAVLRRQIQILIPFTTMMLASYVSRGETIAFLRRSMMVDLDPGAAALQLRKKIEAAPGMLKTRVKNIVHSVATGDITFRSGRFWT